jgi:hypothetical protein
MWGERHAPLLAVALAAVVVPVVASGAASGAKNVLLVAPNGSDSGACTGDHPCRSINRAYHVARPGDVVQLTTGEYPTQVVLYDASKEGAPRNVVVRPAPGAHVRLAQLTIGPNRFVRGATRLTVEGMTILEDIEVNGCGAPRDPMNCVTPSGGNYIVFRRMDVRGPYGFFCASCDHVAVVDSRIGPPSYGSPCNGSAHPEVANAYDSVNSAKLKRANHLLFDRVVFENFSRCSSSDHSECLQIEPADDVTIRNSTFRNCDTMDVNIANDLAGDSKSSTGHAAPNNILIENNVFASATDHSGGETYYALNIRECTNCTVRYNSWLQEPRMPTGEISAGNAFVGNVGPMSQHNCFRDGVTYSHNVWVGARCGTTDRNVSSIQFVDPSRLDLRLMSTSPALYAGDSGQHPSADRVGRRRPHKLAPDAGAEQREPASIDLVRSIGAARLGMTNAEIASFYGPGRTAQPGGLQVASGVNVVSYARPGGRLLVGFRNDSVVWVSTTSRYYGSSAGLTVGAPISASSDVWTTHACKTPTLGRSSGDVRAELSTTGAGQPSIITRVAIGRATAFRC